MQRKRVSRLELTFRARGGKTYLAEQFVSSPLKILRPFALADERVVLQILNVSPGVMVGDMLELSLQVEQGAKVVIVNQSATKLHTMPTGSARQTLKVFVAAGGECEYYPGLVIPYRDAEFYQATAIFLQKGARFGMLERWSMGRVAHDELFSFRRLSGRLQVYREARLVYGDGLELTPQTASYIGISDKHHYLAAGVWLWDDARNSVDEARAVVRPAFSETSLVHGSFGVGLYLRCFGSDGLEQAHDVGKVLQSWREAHALAPLCLSRFGPGV